MPIAAGGFSHAGNAAVRISGSGAALRPGELRKVHIQRVLDICKGNRLRAAQILGIGRTSLYRYLKRDGENTKTKAKSGGAAA